MGRESEFGEYDDDDDRRGVVQGGEYDQIRTRGRERLKYLAQAKEPKVEWWTCVGPDQNWGTQETIWPLSKAAKSASATPRLQDLAQPKTNFQTGVYVNRPIWSYSCGRVSALSLVDENAMRTTASARVGQLAQHKKYTLHTPHRSDFLYSCGRVSPLWNVSAGALQCGERPHTVDLACPKPPHLVDRAVQWEISQAAKTTKANERVEYLSAPKRREEGQYRDADWPVSESALNSVASSRCIELARSKALAEGFQHAKEIQWPVSKAARRANSSGRLSELAMPIQRVNMNVLQFNPDAFQVKPLAKKGRITSRVEELAQPINR